MKNVDAFQLKNVMEHVHSTPVVTRCPRHCIKEICFAYNSKLVLPVQVLVRAGPRHIPPARSQSHRQM